MVHSPQVVVDVAPTVETEDKTRVDREIIVGAEVETAYELLLVAVSSAVSVSVCVAVVSLTLVEVRSVVSVRVRLRVRVSVVEDVFSVVSVVTQVVLTVTDSVTAGGEVGKVQESAVEFAVGRGGLPETKRRLALFPRWSFRYDSKVGLMLIGKQQSK